MKSSKRLACPTVKTYLQLRDSWMKLRKDGEIKTNFLDGFFEVPFGPKERND